LDEITLKSSTYRVKAAIVVDLKNIPSDKFQAGVFECQWGQEINFCEIAPAAEAWLLY